MTDRYGGHPYIEYRLFDRLPAPRLHWLWPRRIPLGCLTLIVGQPGLGKSLLAVDLAARISAAGPWPDDGAFAPDPPALCTAPPDPAGPDRCPLFAQAARATSPAASGPPNQPSEPAAIIPDLALHTSDSAPRAPDSAPPASDLALHTSDLAPCPAPGAPLCDVATLAFCDPPRPCLFPDTGDLLDCPHRQAPPGQYLATPPRRPRSLAPMGAVFVRPEDSPADVLRPRLIAAGADLTRICVAETVTRRPSWIKLPPAEEYLQRTSGPTDEDDPPLPFVLPDHLDQLGQAVRAFDAPGLVIFDPLTAVLPCAANPKAAAVDAALGALIAFARRNSIAALAVAHLTKQNSHRPLYRVRGSVSLIAAARAVYVVSADPEDRDRRIVSALKSVYGPPPAALAFRILPGPRLQWEPPAAGILPHASDLPPDLADLSADAHSALSEACDWLASYLLDGPRPAAALIRDARAAGHSLRTLKRAKRLLAARSYKPPAGRGWLWAGDQHSRVAK
jgi:hypothetical protein